MLLNLLVVIQVLSAPGFHDRPADPLVQHGSNDYAAFAVAARQPLHWAAAPISRSAILAVLVAVFLPVPPLLAYFITSASLYERQRARIARCSGVRAGGRTERCGLQKPPLRPQPR